MSTFEIEEREIDEAPELHVLFGRHLTLSAKRIRAHHPDWGYFEMRIEDKRDAPQALAQLSLRAAENTS